MEKAPPGPLIHIGANGIGIFKVLSNSWSYFYDSIIDDFGLWIDLQGRSKVPPPPFVSHVLSKQTTTWKFGEKPRFGTVWRPLWKILATPLDLHESKTTKHVLHYRYPQWATLFWWGRGRGEGRHATTLITAACGGTAEETTTQSKWSAFRRRGRGLSRPHSHYDHSDLRQGSTALAFSNTGSPRFTDFPSNLANLIGWEYETNTLHMLRK